eukprot:2973749-Pleurochrysis_carterae.AAC.1
MSLGRFAAEGTVKRSAVGCLLQHRGQCSEERMHASNNSKNTTPLLNVPAAQRCRERGWR